MYKFGDLGSFPSCVADYTVPIAALKDLFPRHLNALQDLSLCTSEKRPVLSVSN